MQDQVNDQMNTLTKKAGQNANKIARQAKGAVTEAAKTAESAVTETEFSLDGLFANFKSMIASFDKHPLTFIKENPVRATLGGFFIGLIFGAAMSKRSVTK